MIFRQLFDSVSSTYSYVLASRRGGEALVVDPVLEKVDRYLKLMEELDLRLVKAVETHLHADHITGLGALRDRTRCVTVMGEQSKVDVVSMRIAEGDRLTVEGVSLDVLYTPGHTDDSYSFVLGDRVFTGDTLFAAGCGRLFEGTPEMMYESLCKVIGALPRATRVYFGHEYTENNLRFAAMMEPENAAIRARLARVHAIRQAGGGTTPSTLEDEWATNPFMRSDSPAILAKVKALDPANDLSPAAVLGAVRKLKDTTVIGSK